MFWHPFHEIQIPLFFPTFPPLYGYANLDAYLGASKEAGWNVQNLANSGLTSLDLIKHLSL